jgi:hypothetical protein
MTRAWRQGRWSRGTFWFAVAGGGAWAGSTSVRCDKFPYAICLLSGACGRARSVGQSVGVVVVVVRVVVGCRSGSVGLSVGVGGVVVVGGPSVGVGRGRSGCHTLDAIERHFPFLPIVGNADVTGDGRSIIERRLLPAPLSTGRRPGPPAAEI